MTSLPLSRRLHRLKIRLRKRADFVFGFAMAALVLASFPVFAVMELCGYEFEDDGQGVPEILLPQN